MVNKPSKEFDRDREFTVILEKIHSDFKIFGEDLSSLKKRMDMFFEELGKQKEQIVFIKADIRTLKTDVQTLKTDVQTLKGDMTSVKSDIAEIKSDFNKRLAHL